LIEVLMADALKEYHASKGSANETVLGPHIKGGEEVLMVALLLSKQKTLEAGVLQLTGVDKAKGHAIAQLSGKPEGHTGFVPEQGGAGEQEITAAQPARVIDPSDVKRMVMQPNEELTINAPTFPE